MALSERSCIKTCVILLITRLKASVDMSSWTIMARGIILLILVALITSVHPQTNEDSIVLQCQFESTSFTNNEEQYIDKSYHDPLEPVLPAPGVKEFERKVYTKENLQRPFECISNRTNIYSKFLVEANPNYQAMAMQCKKEQPQPYCDRSRKYQSIDGTCNNLLNPNWGSMLTCVRRYITPRYEGASGFRQSVCGQPLPDARTISLSIHQDQTRPTRDATHMATFFGQLVAHDLTDSPTSTIDTKPIDCCSHHRINQHPQCAPILISRDDPFYSKYGFTCLNFVRAATCDSCEIGKRNQLNQATSYIDLSSVYGSSENVSSSLRAHDGTGKMKARYINGEELMPANYDIEDCGSPKDNEYCFHAGDRRVNQHTTLMILHTVFRREHNRIAEQLHQLNPQWDDETLFQESRKINIAQMQAIIYKEYLPLLLGPDLMTSYDLWLNGQDLTFYDPSIDVTLRAEFNTAAFRLHSTIKDVVSEFDNEPSKRLLRFQFQDTEPLYNGNMSSLMEGISLSPAEKYDRFVTLDMTGFLKKKQKGSYGLDIAAVNIQRGRDFGLPSYTEILSFLSQGSVFIQTFEQLQNLIERDNIEALRKIYCDVRDIDLWVGMNSEKVQENMIVGPSAGTLIALQFRELKKGDRFYFEHFGNFNHEKLKTLKTSTLSNVLCRNLNIKTMQINALMFPNYGNPVVLCKDIPKLDLNLWKV